MLLDPFYNSYTHMSHYKYRAETYTAYIYIYRERERESEQRLRKHVSLLKEMLLRCERITILQNVPASCAGQCWRGFEEPPLLALFKAIISADQASCPRNIRIYLHHAVMQVTRFHTRLPAGSVITFLMPPKKFPHAGNAQRVQAAHATHQQKGPAILCRFREYTGDMQRHVIF